MCQKSLYLKLFYTCSSDLIDYNIGSNEKVPVTKTTPFMNALES